MPISAKPNMKENWEQLRPASKMENVADNDRALKPSRAGVATDQGGSDPRLKSNPSIFDSDFKFKEDKYSQHAQEAGRQKRKERSNRGKQSAEARAEWEQVTPAKTTADVPVVHGGVTPNRSALEPGKIPEVKLDLVAKAIKSKEQSRKAGEEAANLKTQMDGIFQKREENVSNNWEQEALDKINTNATRKMSIYKGSIETAPDFVPQTPTGKNPLAGLFAVPADPEKAKEVSIKRDASQLKQERKTRQDDRSWERASLPTKSH